MSLSQENIDKLCMTGLYRCEPVLKWLPEYKRNNPYWCKNWTFRVGRFKDQYYMRDTYWATGDENPVLLTDENFDLFELVFDFNDVEKFNLDTQRWLTYAEEDRWCVAVDSGGNSYPKYYIRKGSMPVKKLVAKRLSDEIQNLKLTVKVKTKLLDDVLNDNVDLRYI